jgi:hypothetical protein
MIMARYYNFRKVDFYDSFIEVQHLGSTAGIDNIAVKTYIL